MKLAGLLVGAALLLLSAACGREPQPPSPEQSALGYARDACSFEPPPGWSDKEYARQVASFAASAAQRDPRWDDLSRATGDLAEFMESDPPPGYGPPKVRAAFDIIGVECRKALAP